MNLFYEWTGKTPKNLRQWFITPGVSQVVLTWSVLPELTSESLACCRQARYFCFQNWLWASWGTLVFFHMAPSIIRKSPSWLMVVAWFQENEQNVQILLILDLELTQYPMRFILLVEASHKASWDTMGGEKHKHTKQKTTPLLPGATNSHCKRA